MKAKDERKQSILTQKRASKRTFDIIPNDNKVKQKPVTVMQIKRDKEIVHTPQKTHSDSNAYNNSRIYSIDKGG